KRIGAGEVFYVIETVIWINREHSGRAENVNIARCDINAVNQLSLILAEGLLIKLIRRLEAVAREEQIQVKRVFGVRAVIDAIKNAAGRSLVMQHGELRRVKKTARTLEVKSNKVAGLCIAESQRSILAYRAERSISCAEVARGLLLIQT